MKFMDVKLRF